MVLHTVSYQISVYRCLIVLTMFFAAAQNAYAGDVRAPTSAWLVGLSSVSSSYRKAEEAVKLPCVMMVQYDNGMVFRFSGDDNKILTAAIDFRQALFEPGTKYTLDIALGEAFWQAFDAVAYDPATLILSLHDPKGFYTHLKKERILSLNMRETMGGRSFSFALFGLENGLKRLSRCYREQGRVE